MVKKGGSADEYRSFKVAGSSIGFSGGTYISKSPSSAARKAAHKLFHAVNKEPHYQHYKSVTSIKFILVEKTQGSSHKSYFYDAVKLPYDKPIEREIPNPKDPKNPIVIKYYYDVKLRTCHESEMHSVVPSHVAASQ